MNLPFQFPRILATQEGFLSQLRKKKEEAEEKRKILIEQRKQDLTKKKLAFKSKEESLMSLPRATVKEIPGASKQFVKDVGKSFMRFPFSAGEAVFRLPFEGAETLTKGKIKAPDEIPAQSLPGILSKLGPIQSYQSEAKRREHEGKTKSSTLGKTAFDVALDEPIGFLAKPLLAGVGFLDKAFLKRGGDDAIKATLRNWTDEFIKIPKGGRINNYDEVIDLAPVSSDVTKTYGVSGTIQAARKNWKHVVESRGLSAGGLIDKTIETLKQPQYVFQNLDRQTGVFRPGSLIFARTNGKATMVITKVDNEAGKLKFITTEYKNLRDFNRLLDSVERAGGTTLRLASPVPLVVPPTKGGRLAASLPTLQPSQQIPKAMSNVAESGEMSKSIIPNAPTSNVQEKTGLTVRPRQLLPGVNIHQSPPLPPPTDASLAGSVLPPSDPVKKVIQAIKEAKPLRGNQEKIYAKIRAQQTARISSVGQKVAGEKGYFAQLGQLKGEMPKVQFESIRPQLVQQDIDELFNRIEGTSKLYPLEKVTAKSALAKLLGAEGGHVPTQSELLLLKDVFPPEFVDEILKKRPFSQKLMSLGVEVLNLPRAIMATMDLSAPLRQGVFFIGRPKQWVPAFKDMFKYAFSEKAYQGLMDDIVKRPTYQLMRQSKLAITDINSFDLQSREEQFMSNLVEKIPGFGRIARASNRAYSGFLNKLRADVFDDLVTKAKQLGVGDDVTVDSIARFINSATGRGSIGVLNKATPVLNGIFFSPRLMMSRINLLNPQYYISLEPFARKEAIKSLLSFGAVAGTIITLAKLGGLDIGTDPRSADFGKIKSGNTRYDPWGGFQQYIVALYRLVSGEMVSSTTGREFTLGEGYKPTTRLDIAFRLLQSKTSPVASFIVTLFKEQNFAGDPVNVPAEVIDRFIPMLVADITEATQEKGAVGGLLASPAIFGVGSQTYTDQIPFKSKTTSGEDKIDWRAAPSAGEQIWNKITGKEISQIPKEEWPSLQEERKQGILRDIQLTKIKSEVLQTGEPQTLGETLIYLDNGVVRTKKINNPEDAPEIQEKLRIKSRFDVDESFRTQAQSIYDKIQSFKGTKGWTNAEKTVAQKFIDSLSEEEYETYQEYKKWKSTQGAFNTKKVRDLLYPNPAEAVIFIRSLPEQEAKRIIELLDDAEYAQYEKGK